MNHQLELTDIKRDWIEDAFQSLLPMLPSLGEFTSDDLHGRLPEPSNVNYFGCLMAKLRNEGLIERVNARPSKRPESNGRLISVWRVKG